jgi:outer membrane immunogenic protein
MNKYALLASVSASTFGLVGAAGAADLPASFPTKAAPMFAPNWSGFYIGINAGVVSHSSTTKDLGNWADEGYVSNNQQKSTGGTVGGTFGFNLQEDAFVYGVEADINWVSNSATDNIGVLCPGCTGPDGTGRGGVARVRSEMNWMSTVRARAGVTVGSTGATLIYFTGGLALAGIKNSWGAGYQGTTTARAALNDESFLSDGTRLGWVVGGGFEHKLRALPGWSVKGEGLWMDFENKTVSNPGPSTFNGQVRQFNTQFQNQAVVGRVGLNYAFH